eukprot:5455982-Prymnesium_polylepis.4
MPVRFHLPLLPALWRDSSCSLVAGDPARPKLRIALLLTTEAAIVLSRTDVVRPIDWLRRHGATTTAQELRVNSARFQAVA